MNQASSSMGQSKSPVQDATGFMYAEGFLDGEDTVQESISSTVRPMNINLQYGLKNYMVFRSSKKNVKLIQKRVVFWQHILNRVSDFIDSCIHAVNSRTHTFIPCQETSKDDVEDEIEVTM